MSFLALAARLILAAILLVSGLAKLADRSGSQQAVRDFGVPKGLAGLVAAVLPFIELVIAIALLPARTAQWAGLAVAVLMGLFTVAIAINLIRGRKPDCHCFGQLTAEPIGWSTAGRNLVLVALGLFVFAEGFAAAQLSAVEWVTALRAAEIANLIVAAAALTLSSITIWLLMQLLGQHGRLLNRLESLETAIANSGGVLPSPAAPSVPSTPQVGLAPGSAAPAFRLKGLYDEDITLDSLRASGKSQLLLFADPNCGPCTALMPDVGRWQRELQGDLSVVVISRGESDENRAKRGEYGLTQVLLQNDREVSEAYQAWGTPSAVLVRADGTIGSYVAQGSEAIRALVSRQIDPTAVPMLQQPAGTPCPHCGQVHPAAPAAPPADQGLPVGTPAPALKLPDLAGAEVDLEDYRGRETLLVFWNPGCGFCQRLLPELKDWESNRPEDAPAVLLVSTGDVQANAAHGLMSTIVLDDSWKAGAAFGATGTPSAVLVDSEGKIASPIGVGGPAVLELANKNRGGQTA
jgi:peroxiredoxin